MEPVWLEIPDGICIYLVYYFGQERVGSRM